MMTRHEAGLAQTGVLLCTCAARTRALKLASAPALLVITSVLHPGSSCSFPCVRLQYNELCSALPSVAAAATAAGSGGAAAAAAAGSSAGAGAGGDAAGSSGAGSKASGPVDLLTSHYDKMLGALQQALAQARTAMKSSTGGLGPVRWVRWAKPDPRTATQPYPVWGREAGRHLESLLLGVLLCAGSCACHAVWCGWWLCGRRCGCVEVQQQQQQQLCAPVLPRLHHATDRCCTARPAVCMRHGHMH